MGYGLWVLSNGLTKHGLNNHKDGQWFNVKEKQSNKMPAQQLSSRYTRFINLTSAEKKLYIACKANTKIQIVKLDWG